MEQAAPVGAAAEGDRTNLYTVVRSHAGPVTRFAILPAFGSIMFADRPLPARVAAAFAGTGAASIGGVLTLTRVSSGGAHSAAGSEPPGRVRRLRPQSDRTICSLCIRPLERPRALRRCLPLSALPCAGLASVIVCPGCAKHGAPVVPHG